MEIPAHLVMEVFSEGQQVFSKTPLVETIVICCRAVIGGLLELGRFMVVFLKLLALVNHGAH